MADARCLRLAEDLLADRDDIDEKDYADVLTSLASEIQLAVDTWFVTHDTTESDSTA